MGKVEITLPRCQKENQYRTSPSVLQDQYMRAAAALHKAYYAVHEAAPTANNFFNEDARLMDEEYTKALHDHGRRLDTIHKLKQEFYSLFDHVHHFSKE
jgi:hypothetical protein